MCVSTLTNFYESNRQQWDADEQRDDLRVEAKIEREQAAKRAARIRRAGASQQSQATSDLASAGVSVSSGTALKIAREPAAQAEEDALEEILYGERRADRLKTAGDRIHKASVRRARYGMINAVGGSLLSGGSSYGSGWTGGSGSSGGDV